MVEEREESCGKGEGKLLPGPAPCHCQQGLSGARAGEDGYTVPHQGGEEAVVGGGPRGLNDGSKSLGQGAERSRGGGGEGEEVKGEGREERKGKGGRGEERGRGGERGEEKVGEEGKGKNGGKDKLNTYCYSHSTSVETVVTI